MNKSNYKIQHVPDNDTGTVSILLEGNIGIENISRISEELLAIQLMFNNVILEIKKAYKIDLSTIQMIYSLVRFYRESNVKVEIRSDMREDQKSSIRLAGFTDFI